MIREFPHYGFMSASTNVYITNYMEFYRILKSGGSVRPKILHGDRPDDNVVRLRNHLRLMIDLYKKLFYKKVRLRLC